MSSPFTVSFKVPYTENEQRFLIRVVQTAVRALRSINANPRDGFTRYSPTTISETTASPSEPEHQHLKWSNDTNSLN